MNTATLLTAWPAMAVHPVRLRKEWLTADEIASGTLILPDQTINFVAIDLPPTPVAIHHGALIALLFGNGDVGMVAACKATGSQQEGKIEIFLDEEPVVMEDGQMIAKSMPATVRVTLANGDVWTSADTEQPTGYGIFPDCPVVNGVAQPVTARFRLTK